MKFCMISSIIAAFCTICFSFSCPNLNFAGVTSSYNNGFNLESKGVEQKVEYKSNFDQSFVKLESKCNSDCKCSKTDFEPVSISKKK